MSSSQVKFSADRRTLVKQYDPIYRCGGIKREMCKYEGFHTTPSTHTMAKILQYVYTLFQMA